MLKLIGAVTVKLLPAGTVPPIEPAGAVIAKLETTTDVPVPEPPPVLLVPVPVAVMNVPSVVVTLMSILSPNLYVAGNGTVSSTVCPTGIGIVVVVGLVIETKLLSMYTLCV